jgi:hypothetical protein
LTGRKEIHFHVMFQHHIQHFFPARHKNPTPPPNFQKKKKFFTPNKKQTTPPPKKQKKKKKKKKTNLACSYKHRPEKGERKRRGGGFASLLNDCSPY